MTKTPLISVIILSYNTKKLTTKCLKRLKKSIDRLGKPVEVIVVENGSDGTEVEIKKNYSWVKLVEPKENTGFAIGNNIGIKKANKNSKYYLLLNSDAFLEKETLTQSVNFMESHKDAGVMGCKLLFEDKKLQPSAGYLPTPLTVAFWAWGLDLIPGLNRLLRPFHPNYPEFFETTKNVGWVTGAFWFLRNEVIKKTKGFDENYFMYGEEIEWSKRINDAGFNFWYTPEFEIVHLFSKSSKSTRNAYLREVEGLYYCMNKYYPKSLPFVKIVVRLGMILRAFTFFVLGNKFRAKVHWDAVKIK